MSVVPYRLDAADPRAPTLEQWAAMSVEERARVVDSLPSEPPSDALPEGDRHRIPKEKAVEALREYFRRIGRRVYLSAELPVYYPGERWFAPDLIAVVDAEPGPREKWVVLTENKGLDLVLEVSLSGDRRKDLETNVVLYARLGIPEYFVLDLKAQRIIGYHLDSSRPGTYVPIIPQAGRWPSQVLGLDLVMESGRIRFFHGTAALLEADELVARLSAMVDELVRKEEDLAQSLDEERLRAHAAEQRADSAEQRAGSAEQRAGSAEQRAARLAERLRELGVDPDEK